MENPAVLILGYKMRTGTFIKWLIFLVVLLVGFSNSYAELYSGGPWRGKVIDADTKEPIEGAVVVAYWDREYEGHPAGAKSFLHDIRETLTDKNGQWEVPAYIETVENKHLSREKDLQGSGIPKLFITGPKIRDPKFIIYKPSFGNYRGGGLLIFAIGPSKVEYLHEYKGTYKDGKTFKGDPEYTYAKKTIKQFPEGLVYMGGRCEKILDSLKKITSFNFRSLFIPLDNAKDKIGKMDIPLDCPENGEPVPERNVARGYKSDIKDRPMENGYVIIELPRLKTKEERRNAKPAPEGGKEDWKKQKLLIKLIREEWQFLTSKDPGNLYMWEDKDEK